MGFQDLPYAQQFRDVIRDFVKQEIKRLRPDSQLATVDTVNADDTCNVFFPGDEVSVPVRVYTTRPITGGGIGSGDVVRVTGDGARKYVTEVVKGRPFLRAGRIAATMIESTASSANTFVDSATGVFYRVTSSIRYKKNVETVTPPSEESIKQLRAVTYEALNRDNGKTYLGLIAEEIHALGDPVLNKLVEYDYYGRPDAVNYDRLAVVLLPIIQQLLERVEQLEHGRDQA